MPGRVNVKFVVMLVAVLVALFGAVAGAVYFVITKSGEEYAQLARQHEAEGEWKSAASDWSRAVAHEQDNIEWLEAWLNAQQKLIPETRLDYNEAFNKKYINILRQLADVQRTNVEAHERYLTEQRIRLTSSFNASNEEFFLTEVGRVLGYFATAPEDGGWRTLRRYRGDAIVRLLSNRAEIDEDRIALAKEDLEAALAADPSLGDAALALYTWHTSLAEIARRERRESDAEAATADAAGVISTFIENNPESPFGHAMSLSHDLQQQNKQLEQDELDPAALVLARREYASTKRPELGDLVSLIERSDELDARLASIAIQLVAIIDPENAATLGDRIWARAEAINPDDASIAFAAASFKRRTDRRQEAMEKFAELADRPNPPVSAKGLLTFGFRDEAAYRRVVTALEIWDSASDNDPERAELLSRAKQLRDQLSDSRSETDASMLLLDAKFAVADDDFNLADRKLREYNEATSSSNPESLRLTGIVAQRQGNTGAALDAFQQALRLDSGDVFSLVGMSQVHQSMGNFPEALTTIEAAAQLRPQNASIMQQRQQLRILMGMARSDDPAQNLLLQAEARRGAGDTAGMIVILEQGAREFPGRVEFHAALARIRLTQGDRELARRSLDLALALEPDDAGLKRLDTLLSTDDPVEAGRIAINENAELSPLQKKLRLHQLYLTTGNPEQADTELDQAIEMSPEDPGVLEASFERAVRNSDADAARALLPTIGRLDLDGAQGRAYEARVLLIENKLDQAENVIRAAIDQGSTNPASYILLGQILETQGRVAPALDSYEEAYRIRPHEIPTLRTLLDALIRQQRLGRALEIARSALGVARSDAGFRQRWLLLEGQAGDRDLALNERLAIAEADPNNAQNNLQIIALLLDLGRYDEARRAIDQARAQADSFQLVQLDARWHADRNDLNSARAVFVDYLVENAATIEGPETYLAFGRFLLDRRDIEGGLRAVRQAATYQDPDNPIAEFYLGSQLFALGRNEEAVEIYRSLIDRLSSKQPPDDRVPTLHTRLAEIYVRLGRFDDASESLAQVGDSGSNDLSTQLLRADIAAGRGQEQEAGRLYDGAVADWPDSVLALLKRAQFRMQTGQEGDAIADLESVLEIEPGSTQALRLRATIRYSQGDTREAISDLLAAVESAPDDTPLRLLAIRQLITDDRPEDAADLGEEGIRRSPSDLAFKVRVGGAFESAGMHRRANTYYEQAWEQSKTISVATRYVNSLLSMSSPEIDTARAVSRAPALNDSGARPALLMLRARVEGADKNYNEARSLTSETLELVRDNVPQLSAWVDAMPEIFGDDEAADYIAELSRDQLGLWGDILVSRSLAQHEPTGSDGVRRLRSLEGEVTDPAQKRFIQQSLSVVYIGQERFDEAIEIMRALLETTPDSPETLNNLAYVLATEQGQSTEALELSERAAELAPRTPSILDTLGFIHLEMGNAESALPVLERAVSLAGSGSGSVPMRINLARAHLATGDSQAARRESDVIDDIVRADSSVRDRYGDRLDKLAEELRR